jgi:hypothetical protein
MRKAIEELRTAQQAVERAIWKLRLESPRWDHADYVVLLRVQDDLARLLWKFEP